MRDDWQLAASCDEEGESGDSHNKFEHNTL